MTTQSAPGTHPRAMTYLVPHPVSVPVPLRATLMRAAALGLVLGLAACGGSNQNRAQVEIRGTDPASGATAGQVASAPATQPIASGGIVDYGSYQTAVANEGETVADLAARAGLSASALAAYNGLTPAHRLRAGDELVLPSRPGGYTATPAAPATMPGATGMSGGIVTAPLSGAGTPMGTPTGAPSGAGTTPAGQWSPSLAAAAIQNSTGLNPDGSLAAPPSSARPVPPGPPAAPDLASPDMGQYQTGQAGTVLPPPAVTTDVTTAAGIGRTAPTTSGAHFVRPVQGPVAAGFSKAPGESRNYGVDFAATAGAPVVAAADGTVALVSQSLGDLGTIVLLRHADGLLTVYGRVDDVTVKKGDTVSAGQQIGVVLAAAPSEEPRMHFEVRRGAESLDPMQFL